MSAGEAAALPELYYSLEDYVQLNAERGANCGPGAIAAICGARLETVVDDLGPRLQKLGGTTEMMLLLAVQELGFSCLNAVKRLPKFGLARVQWAGPWMAAPEVFAPQMWSHWIGAVTTASGLIIFDVNALPEGGWIAFETWSSWLVPEVIMPTMPEASGDWWIDEAFEVSRPGHPDPVLK